MITNIVNKNFILRPYSPNDLNDLKQLVSTEDIYNIMNITHYPNDEELLAWINYWNSNGNIAVYAVEHNKKVIGTVSLAKIGDNVHEIMYWFSEQYRRLGFATSAIKAVIKDFKKTSSTKFLLGLVPSTNEISMRILTRFGFLLQEIYKDTSKGKNVVFYKFLLDISKFESASPHIHKKNSKKKH